MHDIDEDREWVDHVGVQRPSREEWPSAEDTKAGEQNAAAGVVLAAVVGQGRDGTAVVGQVCDGTGPRRCARRLLRQAQSCDCLGHCVKTWDSLPEEQSCGHPPLGGCRALLEFHVHGSGGFRASGRLSTETGQVTTHTHVYTHPQARRHARTHTHTRARARAHTHTYTHTYTHTLNALKY